MYIYIYIYIYIRSNVEILMRMIKETFSQVSSLVILCHSVRSNVEILKSQLSSHFMSYISWWADFSESLSGTVPSHAGLREQCVGGYVAAREEWEIGVRLRNDCDEPARDAHDLLNHLLRLCRKPSVSSLDLALLGGEVRCIAACAF